MGISANLLHLKAGHCLDTGQNWKGTCKPVTHLNSQRTVRSPSPSPASFPGYTEVKSLFQLDCRCGRKRLLPTYFPTLIYVFCHIGSRKQSYRTFLICSDGMKSHGPGQEDHDGYCPYVEIGSCDLGRREKNFSQRMKCGCRWKQTPTRLQPSTWMGSCCRYQEFNLSPTPVSDPPNTSGVGGEIRAPARPATQAEEGSVLHYTALLSPKSAEGDMAVLIHVDTIAITAMP